MSISKAFIEVVQARRSIRVYDGTPMPDEIVQQCLDLALLAPNSSNLQSWEFIRIKNPDVRAQIIKACFSQPSAATSAELIVCVARTDTWKKNSELMAKSLKENAQKSGKSAPFAAIKYYIHSIPKMFSMGPFGIFGFIKKVQAHIRGLSKPTAREPFSNNDMKIWAVKTSALACENLMLAFSAFGFDSCPMEGFDSVRVKKILQLSRGSVITMIVSAGKRAPNGVYGPRIRFDRNLFIREL